MTQMSTVAWLRRAAITGVIGGVVLVYLALVGLIEAFADRDVITGILTLGRLMLPWSPSSSGIGLPSLRAVSCLPAPVCAWPAASWPALSPAPLSAC